MKTPHSVYGIDVGLGKEQAYPQHYSPHLLQPIARSLCRQQLPALTFYGSDLWTAYEVSWLQPSGVPAVALMQFSVPASSPSIIESKSFKYYLNSLNQTPFNSPAALQQLLTQDLSQAAGAPVEVCFLPTQPSQPTEFPAQCVDTLAASCSHYLPQAALLQVQAQPSPAPQVLCSHLLKSNCPVTGQPDWASLWVGLEGAALVPEAFLAYVVSYRQHQDFHENCVERIYCDLWQQCVPQRLWVYARYTRRGGLDINPFRSSHPMAPPRVWAFRQ